LAARCLIDMLYLKCVSWMGFIRLAKADVLPVHLPLIRASKQLKMILWSTLPVYTWDVRADAK
ncbi:hypothetical protein ACJX0J_027973, partial [Zea mays]